MESNEEILKNVKERVSKRDKSLKLLFKPKCLIMGGEVLRLQKDSPFTFEVNTNDKLAIRFIMENNEQMGIIRTDFGVSLTQLAVMLVATQDGQKDPMIACHITKSCFAKICNVQPKLKKLLELGIKSDPKKLRELFFPLRSWDIATSTYLKVKFNDDSGPKEHQFDADQAMDVLSNEVCAVWNQMVKENPKSEKLQSLDSEFPKLVNILHHGKFEELLREHGLVQINLRGEFRFTRVRENPHLLRRVKLNNRGYRGKNIPTDKRVTKKKGTQPLKRKWLEDEPAVKILRTKNEVWCRGPNTPDNENRSDGALVAREVSSPVLKIHNYNCDVENQMTYPRVGERMKFGYAQQHYNELPLYEYQEEAIVAGLADEMRRMGRQMEPQPYPQFGYQHGHAGIINGNRHFAHFPAFIDPSQGDAARGNNKQPRIEGRMAVQHVLEDEEEEDEEEIGSEDDEEEDEEEEEIPQGEEILLQFPPPSVQAAERLTILLKDLKTLDRNQFLNDTIMAFMLNFICCYKIKKELRDTIWMQNSFFYTRLAKNVNALCFSGRLNRTNGDDEKLEENVQAMQSWTKRFDLFKKDYIVIPVNEDLHWMVVVIVNPAGALVNVENEEESRKVPKCYIIFYDPLSGLDPTRRTHVSFMLRKYLERAAIQYKAPGKKFADGGNFVYDDSRVISMRPKNTPIQNNYSDCGLYALHFIEGFFCGLNGRVVTINDFPDLDWFDFWPESEKMCEVMRDKVYNLILKTASPPARSRLDKYEKYMKVGLNREGEARKSRRHSAPGIRRAPRDVDNIYRRHYSLNPPPGGKLACFEPLFMNPRTLAKMPVTQRVRSMACPIVGFPAAY